MKHASYFALVFMLVLVASNVAAQLSPGGRTIAGPLALTGFGGQSGTIFEDDSKLSKCVSLSTDSVSDVAVTVQLRDASNLQIVGIQNIPPGQASAACAAKVQNLYYSCNGSGADVCKFTVRVDAVK